MDAEFKTRTVETDAGQATRAAIGVVVLQTDETIEHDLRAMMPVDGVRHYVNRIANRHDVTEATLRAMENDLPAAAARFPEALTLDVVGYGCTSASLVIGEARVGELLTVHHPGTPATNPYTAVKAACAALGVRRLGLVSPYDHSISASLRAGLEAGGIGVPAICSFGEREDHVVARMTPKSVLNAIVATGTDSECDAVFASCTNLRAADVVAEAERQLRKPVLCSNQVLAWHMMRLAGLDDRVKGFGRLFDCAGD